MGMTITEKILASAAGLKEVHPGQLIMANLDMVLGNDITSPVAIKEFPKFGKDHVFDKDKVALVPDHFTPNKDIKAAEQCACVRAFAKSEEITNYFEVGRVGIEHALLPEKGLGMAIGKAWFKVPSTIRFRLSGKLREHVSGKDLILTIIGMIGVDGALYRAMEFAGEGVHSLSMDDRFTIANMAIEAGAKNGIFPVDEKTLEYLKEHGAKEPKIFYSDEDAEYEKTIDIDLGAINPTVSYPHLPENTHDAKEGKDIKIDQVVIGSCTNGRLSDLEAAAKVLKGRKIADGVRCIVIPATQRIWLEAMHEGLFDIFVEAGCVVSTPTCGPCLGGYMGILSEGEKCVSTTNRNFVGRMGHVKSEVYLASPETAAASAVMGYIADPEEVGYEG